MKRVFTEYAAVWITVAGLIGLIWSFNLTNGFQVVASLAIFTVGAVLIGVRVLQSKTVEYTIVKMEKTLVLHDTKGEQATLTRSSWEIAGSEGLGEIWFRNIAADGKILNVKIDGEPAQEGINIVHQTGLTHIRKVLPRPLNKGEEIQTIISYDLVYSFLKPTEALIHVVNYKTKRIKLLVQFPNERPFRSAEFVEVFGGTKPITIGRFPVGGIELVAEAENVHLGAHYELRWNW